MKKLLKSEVCGSHEQCTGPANWWKVIEKLEIYGYCSWTIAVCPLETRDVAGKKKEKKKRKGKTQETWDAINATCTHTDT